MQWSAHFSSDADAGMGSRYCLSKAELLIEMLGVIEDARFKRKEALADLATAATKK